MKTFKEFLAEELSTQELTKQIKKQVDLYNYAFRNKTDNKKDIKRVEGLWDELQDLNKRYKKITGKVYKESLVVEDYNKDFYDKINNLLSAFSSLYTTGTKSTKREIVDKDYKFFKDMQDKVENYIKKTKEMRK